MKVTLFVLLIVALASASLIDQALHRVKLQASRPRTLGTRSIYDCQDQASKIAVATTIGQAKSGPVNETHCGAYYFDAASVTANLEITVSNDNSAYLAVSVGYVDGTNDDGTDDFWTLATEYTYGGVIVVPVCSFADADNPSPRWYILVSSYISATYQFNTALVPPAPAVNISEGQVSVATTISRPSYYNILLSDRTVAKWVNITSVTTEPAATVEFYADAKGLCASDSIGSSSSTIMSFRTKFRDVLPQIGLIPSTSTQVGFNIQTSSVVCQVPSGLQYCKVDYPIAQYATAAENEGFISFIMSFAASELGANCAAVFGQILCASTFPACDDQGFDRPPCAEDCEILKKHCAHLIDGEAVCFQSEPNSKCYVTEPSSASTIYISVAAVVIGMFATLL